VHPVRRAVADADALARLERRTGPAVPGLRRILKTATVMFGRELDPVVLGRAAAIARACPVMVAVGTSLQVYPAAGWWRSRPTAGARRHRQRRADAV